MLQWHQELMRLRRNQPALQSFNKADIKAQALEQDGLVLMRQSADGSQQMICLFNFSDKVLPYTMPATKTHWSKLLHSKDAQWLQKEEPAEADLADQVAAGQAVDLPPLSVTVYQAQRGSQHVASFKELDH